MDNTSSSPDSTDSTARFTVDLGETQLTDAELHSLQNEITRLAVEHVQKSVAEKGKKEPFVKIIFVKAIHP